MRDIIGYRLEQHETSKDEIIGEIEKEEGIVRGDEEIAKDVEEEAEAEAEDDEDDDDEFDDEDDDNVDE